MRFTEHQYAVVFDFDGTVADTIEAIREGINRTMRELGLCEHTYEDILSFINRGARELVRQAINEEPNGDAARIERALEIYEKHYSDTYMMTESAYDGMVELIERLHDEGFRVGVLSNKQDRFVKGLCKQILTAGSYDAAVGAVPEHPTKPHPYLPSKIADALGVPLDRCIMIGDSHVDVQTAKNAGMMHIGVTWGFRDEECLREAGATHFAHTVPELDVLIHALVNQAN